MKTKNQKSDWNDCDYFISSLSPDVVETIIFDAMEAMNKHAKTLVPILNQHKSLEAGQAYKHGVYAVSIKLGMLIGLDGIERQEKRHNEISKKLQQYLDERKSKE